MIDTIALKINNSTSRRLIAGVAFALLLLAIRQASSGLNWNLPNRAQDFLTLTSSVIIEAIPFVILGVLLSVLIQVWVPKKILIRYLPKHPLLRRASISCMGMFLPVCECGNVPLARGLIAQGFTVAESLTFLLAAPILNPITAYTTHQAFGGDNTILVARLVGGFLVANIIGWIFSKQHNSEALLTPKFIASCKITDQHHRHGKVNKSMSIFIRETNNILPALFAGAAVAGLVQIIMPRDTLLVLGSNPVWSIVAMMLLALIVSICSNVDAFFILAFGSTFTTGSIISFLVFGPIIDIKMLSLMRTTYRTAALVRIALIVALFSALMGLMVNYAF